MKVVGGGGVEGGAKSKIQDFDGCKNMAGNLFQSDIFYADNIIYVVHCCLSFVLWHYCLLIQQLELF